MRIPKKVLIIVAACAGLSLTASGIICVNQLNVKTKSIKFAKGCTDSVLYSSCLGVSWSSEDPKVVSVDEEGRIKALRPGKTEVDASCLWNRQKCEITVTNPELTSASEDIRMSESKSLKVVGTDSEVKWTSNNPDVAKVSGGSVSPVSPGDAVISASVDGKNLECEVKVLEPEIKEMSLKKGDMCIPELLNAPAGPVTWSVADSEIAVYEEDGRIVANNVGKTEVTAVVDNYEIKGTINVTGEQGLEIETKNVRLGESETLKIKNLASSYKVKWDGAKDNGDGTATFSKDKLGKYKVKAVVDTGNGEEKLSAEIIVHNKTPNIEQWNGQLAESFRFYLSEGGKEEGSSEEESKEPEQEETTAQEEESEENNNEDSESSEEPEGDQSDGLEYEYDDTYLSRDGDTFRALKVGTTKVTIKDKDVSFTCDVNIESSPEMTGDTVGENVIAYALQYVGNPYVYGGSSLENGTDCSGFVMRVYEHFGVSLPHSSSSQRDYGTEVDSIENARAGDIICYSGHVALYIGDGRIVHASTPSTGIKISDNPEYRHIVTIRRIF